MMWWLKEAGPPMAAIASNSPARIWVWSRVRVVFRGVPTDYAEPSSPTWSTRATRINLRAALMAPLTRRRHFSLEEIPDQRECLVRLVLQEKMSGVEQVKFKAFQVALVGLRSRLGEDVVILS